MDEYTTPTVDQFGRAFVAEAVRRMNESRQRIAKSLALLTVEQVWHRPNAASNSLGNLVLHLCGNIRQWIITGIGRAEDKRNRDAEFAERGPMPIAELLERFNRTLDEAIAVIEAAEPVELLDLRRVQGFDETSVSIIVHVVEHLSYHTGQIAYVAKATTGEDLGFYRGIDLNRK